MKRFLIIFAAVVAFISAAIGLAAVLPAAAPRWDFISLYHAVLGWWRGGSFYDFVLQRQLMAETAGVSLSQITLEPWPYFPYPPWYLAATFYLGLLPYEWAFRTWMLINLGMLGLSGWLLTDGWHPRQRIFALLAVLLYLPAIGLIAVGNYTLPVLLGASLMVYAFRKQDAALLALGLALITFKPHIGLFFGLIGFGSLFFINTPFAKQAIKYSLLAGLILAGLGFLFEPHWYINFPRALFFWQTSDYINTCAYCISPSNLMLSYFGEKIGPSLASVISLGFLAVGSLWLWFRRETGLKPLGSLLSSAAALTALASPYFVNYDAVILLIPIIGLWRHLQIKGRVLIIALYLLPWLGLIWGRDGNALTTLSGVILFFWVAAIDTTPPAPYNALTN